MFYYLIRKDRTLISFWINFGLYRSFLLVFMPPAKYQHFNTRTTFQKLCIIQIRRQ
ncbi:hypothetical protein Hanom_Chr16g01472111 [Helianthus anomalus]